MRRPCRIFRCDEEVPGDRNDCLHSVCVDWNIGDEFTSGLSSEAYVINDEIKVGDKVRFLHQGLDIWEVIASTPSEPFDYLDLKRGLAILYGVGLRDVERLPSDVKIFGTNADIFGYDPKHGDPSGHYEGSF